ncbi:extracellular solute-binding protein, family 1 [Rubellimicrobium mesophilum DSM 19309]|uniref:Extracellular solute-binding protein, family 1 n=1 Tax=Rubellimicrobium mesophilum DSM 19309 TaxID=442562 RepID=A0A017HSU2_9RHOB|nr:ABC transporter substrate-binding protein [Rubellimicrobium mesophilum]EYD77228.1 extracellular solute-binding protein, family 1 [Rubellimicrobium mesophilum DSM 19309]
MTSRRNLPLLAGVGAMALALSAGFASATPRTNMLHQWATGSDAEAIAKLGEMFTAEGGTWEQTSIAGHTANTLAKLRADVVAGNAPPAVQLKGPEIAEWNGTGMTMNLDEVATAGNWDSVVAPELIEVMKPAGSWVAVPMNIHRVNWMYYNPSVLEAAGVAEAPKTWDEFNAACEKIVAAGKICVAHGSFDWTDATTFDSIVYGMDRDLYRSAFVEGDTEAMRSQPMIDAFAEYRRIVDEWMDPGMPGRPFEEEVAMMANGDAAFLFMGDWTIGTLNAGGYTFGEDYECTQAPVNWGGDGYILNADSVVFFQQDDPDYQEGSVLLANTIMSPEFQTVFNQAKGSIPARMDVDLSQGFNPCQVKSQEDLAKSIEQGTLVRSMAHNMTVPQAMRGAMMEVITEFVNSDMAPEDAANAMADAVEANM